MAPELHFYLFCFLLLFWDEFFSTFPQAAATKNSEKHLTRLAAATAPALLSAASIGAFSILKSKQKSFKAFCRRWQNRHKTTGDVQDLPRSGRPKALSTEMVSFAVKYAEKNPCFNAQSIANALKSEKGVQVSTKTISRILKKEGLKYQFPPVAPFIQPHHAAARVAFAKKNAKRAWRGVMFTDSKYFLLHPVKKGRGIKVWLNPNLANAQPLPKHSSAVHCYMGVTYFGTTNLIFVTGTTGYKSPFINDVTGQAYKGVCGQEYVEVILPKLISEGKQLFASSNVHCDGWTFQQDGAKPHQTANAKNYIASHVPKGLLLDWPANSPDLSWIENVWAWMERKLRQRSKPCECVEELKKELEVIRQQIPLEMLQNCANSISCRLLKVQQNNGYTES